MVTVICLVVAAACWATMNTLTFHHGNSLFASCKPTSFFGVDSWKRKYKSGLIYPAPRGNFYYKLFKLDYKEAFPLSATALAFLTDGYHFLQFIMLWAIAIAIPTFEYSPVYPTLDLVEIAKITLAYRIIWSIVFNMVFTILKT